MYPWINSRQLHQYLHSGLLGHCSDSRRKPFLRSLETVERMHPFSSLTIGIFVAGYITARWDLVTRLYELAIFAWDHGVVVRTQ